MLMPLSFFGKVCVCTVLYKMVVIIGRGVHMAHEMERLNTTPQNFLVVVHTLIQYPSCLLYQTVSLEVNHLLSLPDLLLFIYLSVPQAQQRLPPKPSP